MSVSLEKTIPRDGSPALMPHQGDPWRDREDTFLTGTPGSGSPACSSSTWKLVPFDRHLPPPDPPAPGGHLSALSFHKFRFQIPQVRSHAICLSDLGKAK